jgi:hypothetical protein
MSLSSRLPEKESERLRVYGWSVLAAGLLAAALYYGVNARRAIETDSNEAYSRNEMRQMEVMMGKSGIIMADVQNAFDLPAVRAVVIVAVAGLLALYFFRSAAVLDDEERR